MTAISRLSVVLFLSAALLAGSTARAGQAQMEADFEALKAVPADYVVFGSICEQLARLRLQERYPAPQYRVDVGIEYKVGTRVVGELDVVVFRTQDHEAILIGEVKCRQGLQHAASMAHDQLHRFESTVASNSQMQIYEKTSGRTYQKRQFDESPTYIIISQDGGEVAGFDMTIGHDIDAAKALRTRLMACQAEGGCARVAH